MGAFDGVAAFRLAPLHTDPGPASAVAAARAVAVEGTRLGLPTGGSATVHHPEGLPRCLALAGPPDTDTEGATLILVGLQAGRTAAASGRRRAWGTWRRSLVEQVRLAGWRTTGAAVVPPVPVDDLHGCRPLHGGRTHVALVSAGTTVCDRLPARGPGHDPRAIDCARCLHSTAIARRHDAQLVHHERLVGLVGRLAAGAADRLWLRVGHRTPDELPAVLDAMAGAIAHGFPGAPDLEDVLVRVRRHQEVASSEVQRWASEAARRRLAELLPRVVVGHPHRLAAEPRRQLALLTSLIDANDAAETLIDALEEHGPAIALEPIALAAAWRAGDAASAHVERWRRLHAIAQALGNERAGPPTRPQQRYLDGRKVPS